MRSSFFRKVPADTSIFTRRPKKGQRFSKAFLQTHLVARVIVSEFVIFRFFDWFTVHVPVFFFIIS